MLLASFITQELFTREKMVENMLLEILLLVKNTLCHNFSDYLLLPIILVIICPTISNEFGRLTQIWPKCSQFFQKRTLGILKYPNIM